MQDRLPTVKISPENIHTPESRQFLRYILDRAEVQVDAEVRLRKCAHRLREFEKEKRNALGNTIVELTNLLSKMTKKDELIEGAETLDRLISKLEDYLIHSESKYASVSPINFRNTLLQELKKYESKLDKKKDVLTRSYDYTDMKNDTVIPLFDSQKKMIANLQLDQLSILSRPRGKGKEGGVLEVATDTALEGEGAFGEVRKMTYKVKKQGESSTKILTYGIHTQYGLVDKNSKDLEKYLEKFLDEDSLLSSLEHMHAKSGPLGHIFMRALPNMELFDALYDGKRGLQIDYKAAGSFFVEFAKNLLSAYQTQVESHGLVHRDIKPENLRVQVTPARDNVREINFIDFDLSKPIGAPSKMSGTPDYFAPEILIQNLPSVLPQSDTYVLAMVLIEVLAAVSGYGLELHNYIRQSGSQILEQLSNTTAKDSEVIFDARQQRLLYFLERSLLKTDFINKNQRNEIVDLFKRMLAFNPENRPSRQAVVEKFSEIEFQIAQQQMLEDLFKKEISKSTKIERDQLDILDKELKDSNERLYEARTLLEELSKHKSERQNMPTDQLITRIQKLMQEIASKEKQQLELKDSLDLKKEAIIKRLSNNPESPHARQLWLLNAFDKSVANFLQKKISEQQKEVAEKDFKSKITILDHYKSLFVWLKDEANGYPDAHPLAISYLLNKLQIRAIQPANSWNEIIDNIDRIKINLQQNFEVLTLYKQQLQFLNKKSSGVEDVDVLKLKQLQKEIDEIFSNLEKTPADIDSLFQATEKMKRKMLHINEGINEISHEITALELQKAKKTFSQALHNSGIFNISISKDETMTQKQDLDTIIKDAKDLSTLIKNVDNYIKKIPEGFFHPQGVKQRMEGVLKNYSPQTARVMQNRNSR